MDVTYLIIVCHTCPREKMSTRGSAAAAAAAASTATTGAVAADDDNGKNNTGTANGGSVTETVTSLWPLGKCAE